MADDSLGARLVLVGGGHAHLRVLEEMAVRGASASTGAFEVILVSEDRHHWYSGRVPAYLQGALDESELSFDLEALCRDAGVRFVEGRVASVRAGAVAGTENGPGSPLRIVLDSGREIRAGGASLDVGSVPRGLDVAGVQDHAMGVRPMARARELRRSLDGRIEGTPHNGTVEVAVVGGGPAGVEVVLAVEARIRGRGRHPRVVLVEAGPGILPAFGHRVRILALRILARRGIEVRTHSTVTAVQPGRIVVTGSDRPTSQASHTLKAQCTIWLTGTAPPPLLQASRGLPLDDEGFFLVDDTLRAVGGVPVWGAGDCIALKGHPEMPRAGVFAVRQGPVLATNLMRWLTSGDEEEVRYTPQSSFLALMDTADGRALLRWKGIVWHSRLAGWLKRRIDGRFVDRFQATGASPNPRA